MTNTFEASKHSFTPTNLQLQFLESKLLFLDPQRSGAIPTKDAIDFVRHTGLPIEQQQLVWSIANPQNQPQLNYQQMVVAFRLVSYAQNGIQVSKASLLQNIPVRLPILHDDEDDDDLPPPPQAPQYATNTFGTFGHAVQSGRQQPQQQQPQQPRQAPQQPQSKQQQQPQPPQNIQQPPRAQHTEDMRQFDQMWSRLETFDGMIRGDAVKTLYKKTANRASMAKAWRLCCRTTQGHLTKGELFAFLHLIKLAQEGKPLPDELASQAKNVIQQIDRSNAGQLNRSLNTVKEKMDRLRNARAATMNRIHEFANTEQRINAWIGGMNTLAESYEAALDNLERTVNKLQAEPTRRTWNEQWQRVINIQQKHNSIIDSLAKGELPKSASSQAEEMHAMRQKIIDMVRHMKDIDEEAAKGMRAQLQPLNFAELRSLHDEAVERYEDFKKAEELGRGASYFSSTNS